MAIPVPPAAAPVGRAGRRARWVFVAGAAAALLAVGEGLVLVFHPHRCPPGWTSFDFSAPVGLASLVVTVPVAGLALWSAAVAFGAGGGWFRRLACSSLAAAVAAAVVAAGAAALLGWAVWSNLGTSTSGCLTF